MKSCIDCRGAKPLSEFYAHPRAADGRSGVCKECHKARMKRNRRENPAVQAYDRARSKAQHRRDNARRVSDQWRRDNPEAYKAQTAVGNAIRDGRLEKRPCGVCGATKHVHAHHSDYSRPLDVEWLCALHHHRHHADSK